VKRIFKSFVNRLKLWFSSSLQTRIFVRLVLMSIIPILAIGIIAINLSNRVVKDMATRSTVQMVDRAAVELDALFNDTFYMFKLAQNSPFIQEALKTNFETMEQRYTSDLKISTELFLIAEYKKDIFGIYILGENRGMYKSIYHKFTSDNFRKTEWYNEIMTTDELFYTGTLMDSAVVVTSGIPVISFGVPIVDKATGRRLGIILAELERRTIDNKAGSELGKTGYIMILGNNNEVIVKPDNYPEENIFDFTGIPSTEVPKNNNLVDRLNYSKSKFEDKEAVIYMDKPLVVYRELLSNGWKVVGVIPSEELNRDGRVIGIIVALLIIITSILALLISWAVSKKMVRPLKYMMKQMKRVEGGDLNTSIALNSNDEIGQLENSFNIMVEKIKDLMNCVYNEHEELRKAELRVLQAQINPHFLYNTIDSIIWLARAGRNADVVEMASALTMLFRIGISKGKDIISVGEEIEHVKSYLIIQKLRYKEEFSYDIEVAEQLKKYKIQKLIIQPLVENAIYHGIKMKRERGLIQIKAIDHKEHIVIEVSDTGVGMNEKYLRKLNNSLKQRDDKVHTYGIKNVNERIKMFFGEEYGLRYYSEFGIGTRVEIKIPKILEVESNDKNTPG